MLCTKTTQENWDRFLPEFKKKNVQRKKPHVVKEKKAYTPFPPRSSPPRCVVGVICSAGLGLSVCVCVFWWSLPLVVDADQSTHHPLDDDDDGSRMYTHTPTHPSTHLSSYS